MVSTRNNSYKVNFTRPSAVMSKIALLLIFFSQFLNLKHFTEASILADTLVADAKEKSNYNERYHHQEDTNKDYTLNDNNSYDAQRLSASLLRRIWRNSKVNMLPPEKNDLDRVHELDQEASHSRGIPIRIVLQPSRHFHVHRDFTNQLNNILGINGDKGNQKIPARLG